MARGRAAVLVKDMMRQVWTVSPDASLVIAARAMRDQEVDCLPVVEGDRLLGMITDRDLVVRGVAAGLDPACATVRMAMSGNAITATTEYFHVSRPKNAAAMQRTPRPIAASPPRLRSTRGRLRRSRSSTTSSGVQASNISPSPTSASSPPMMSVCREVVAATVGAGAGWVAT